MSETQLHDETSDRPVACDNCDWEGEERQLAAIHDIHERIEPGREVPVGECPACGCLAYYEEAGVMQRISLEAIARHLPVCGDQFATVCAEWPNGIPISEASAMRAVNLELDLDWLAHRFLPTPKWVGYRRLRDAAWEEYERSRDAALAEQGRSVGAECAEYDRLRDARADPERSIDAECAEYERLMGTAWAKYQRSKAMALLSALRNLGGSGETSPCKKGVT